MRSPFFLSHGLPAMSTRMVPVVDGVMSFALMINAGGQSRRMGRNKALLPVPPDASDQSNVGDGSVNVAPFAGVSNGVGSNTGVPVIASG